MQDSVSTRWTRICSLVACLAVVLAMFAFSGAAEMAWMSLVSVGVALSISMWMASRADHRSVRRMIADFEGHPVPVLASVPPPQCRSLIERN